MNLTKDKKKGTWYVQFYYTDWQGNRKKKFKRGFKTKSEAQEWAMNFLQRQKGDTSLTFGQFIDEYYEDMEKRLKGNTMKTKKYIIEFKIRPFFANKVLSEITPLDIRKWQNELLGKGYKQTYLKTVNNQLSAMFNYAVNFRGLPSNPCRKAGSIGKGRAEEMKFWTLDEYKVFIEGAKDKEVSYIAFQMLYWTGMRIGDDDDKIRLNQRKPSKYKGLSRFGPEKNLQRINKFMKERPIFYKNLIQMKENFRFYLRCFYCITKVVILQFNSENRTELARNG